MERLDTNELREFAFYLNNINNLNKKKIITQLKNSGGFDNHYSVKISIFIDKLDKKPCIKDTLINSITGELNKIIKTDLQWDEKLDGLPSAPVITDLEITDKLNIYLIAAEYIKKKNYKKWYTEIFKHKDIVKILKKNGIRTNKIATIELY